MQYFMLLFCEFLKIDGYLCKSIREKCVKQSLADIRIFSVFSQHLKQKILDLCNFKYRYWSMIFYAYFLKNFEYGRACLQVY